MNTVTADQFAEQLRAGGCAVQIDRSIPGAVYLRASKVTRIGGVDMTIVFDGGRFQRAFIPRVGVHRRRWTKFRTMKGVRWFMEIDEPKTAKPRTLRRTKFTNGYVTSDGRYEVEPVFGSSVRGGDVSRPTAWRLKDRQGQYETRTRPLLSDIRDILKERP